MFTLLDLCVSSLRRGHANLLCIVPILTDDPRRESREFFSDGSLVKCWCVPRSCAAAERKIGKRLVVAQATLHQRSLPTTQAHCPTTEDTAGFCLLCCQPEPVPQSLSTRTSQLTLRCPCGVPTWSGRAINVASRT